MALLDGRLEFSDGQALTSISAAASTISTDVVDLGADNVDGWGTALSPNVGGDLRWTVNVQVALVGASAAIRARLMTHTAAGVSAGTEVASILIPALSSAGWRRSITVPSGGLKRYIGVTYLGVTAKLTSATMDSWLGFGQDENPDTAD